MIKLTPCCKSQHWHFTVGESFGTHIRCRVCDSVHDVKNLIEVVNGLNPLTYFCDNCHKSALDQLKEVATAS